ncbi:MAG: DUF4097 family beta strand repeat-containing protein [Bryobacteraceae bacterium]|nr:DUF4097 family beta strand repeat-containing protein [Bryobacteraceae bacterium]
MLRRLFVFALTATPIAFAWDGDRYKEDFRFTYPLSANGRFSVEGFNGSIELMGWDRNEVEVAGTKYASSEDILKTIKVNIVNAPDSVIVKAERPNDRGWWNNGGGGVKFTLRVPRKTLLDRVSSSNGSIRVEGVEGEARLSSSNGTIRVFNLKGNLDASTSNGGIEAMDCLGGMMLRTSNGGIRAENVRGAFEASTSNGSIRARIESSPAGTPIRARSSNGTIELTMPNYKDQDVRATTSNSSIILRLPASASAQLRANTSHASVQTDFDVSVRGEISKSRIEGKMGNGGNALIDLSSSNGSIRVLKM